MTKFFITAPFITVGSRPARCRIQAIMPVVVDLPLVPATPTRDGRGVEQLGQQLGAGHDARRRRGGRAWTSGTVSSTAPEATRIWSARVTPAAVLRDAG